MGESSTAVTSRLVRQLVLQTAWHAGVGHIGSALSVVDILTALYGDVLGRHDPDAPDRDRVILSKGHGALALYTLLCLRGWITADELRTYCQDATTVGVHPDRALHGVDFSTGSLGYGLGFGAGAALAARLDRSARRCFVLLSDAECNEGAVWEAAMFAAHHRLSSLIAIVDVNGQQALGYTRDVLSLAPMTDKWRAFNWDVHDVDGHDVSALAARIRSLDTVAGPPHVLLARTVFGKGVSYMEGRLDWHYLPMSAAQYEQALREVND